MFPTSFVQIQTGLFSTGFYSLFVVAYFGFKHFKKWAYCALLIALIVPTSTFGFVAQTTGPGTVYPSIPQIPLFPSLPQSTPYFFPQLPPFWGPPVIRRYPVYAPYGPCLFCASPFPGASTPGVNRSTQSVPSNKKGK